MLVLMVCSFQCSIDLNLRSGQEIVEEDSTMSCGKTSVAKVSKVSHSLCNITLRSPLAVLLMSVILAECIHPVSVWAQDYCVAG